MRQLYFEAVSIREIPCGLKLSAGEKTATRMMPRGEIYAVSRSKGAPVLGYVAKYRGRWPRSPKASWRWLAFTTSGKRYHDPMNARWLAAELLVTHVLDGSPFGA